MSWFATGSDLSPPPRPKLPSRPSPSRHQHRGDALEDRFRSALDRNLQFAALRVEMLGVQARELKRWWIGWRRTIKLKYARKYQWALAEERSGLALIARGFHGWWKNHDYFRRRLAHALRHSHLTALSNGLESFRRDAAAHRRERRAARKRALRQQQTLLQLHARLLVMQWIIYLDNLEELRELMRRGMAVHAATAVASSFAMWQRYVEEAHWVALNRKARKGPSAFCAAVWRLGALLAVAACGGQLSRGGRVP